MQRKMYTLLLLACLMVGMLAFPAHAETVEGIYGDNIKWHLDITTGTLTISGTGVAARINEYSGEAYDQYRLSIRHIVIEDGITEIAPYAFKHIFYLESIRIGDTVKVIGEAAFGDNCNVTQLYIGKSVTAIGAYAFGYMEKLQSLTLPSCLESIGVNAFSLCGFREIVIPEGVEVIDSAAFLSCEKLERIVIPVSVTEIRKNAFKFCDKLTDVYYVGTQAQWEAINIDSSDSGNVELIDAALHYDHTHTWDTGTVTKAPGCKTEGEKECTCTECGATGTVKIAPQHHTWDSGTTNADTTVTYQCTKCTATKTEGTPVTETEPPATEPPATEPPATEPPTTEPPATEPPATEPPATEPPATEPPATGNATVGTEATDPVDTNQGTPGEIPWLVIGIGAAVVLVAAGVAVWIWLRKRNPGSQT